MVFKATSLIFFSQLATTLALFLRNVVVARLIGVEDFGIAATFSLLFAVIETVTNLSEIRLVVQDPDGDSKRFTDTLHSVQLIRGFLSAAAMLLLAIPYADFVQQPDLTWAYQFLAIIPLVRGFLHLDVYRLQRHMRFVPYAVNSAASPILGLGIGLLVWTVHPDFRVMLWAIIGQQVLSTVLSHLMAERRFGLTWDLEYVRRALRFGMPLLANGLVLLVVTNGERLIVANQFDMVTLGAFSAALMLATAPTRILINTSNSIFLPKLSEVQNRPEMFNPLATLAMEVNVFFGAVSVLGTALCGPPLLVWFFGADYAGGLMLVVLLGAGQGLLIARNGANIVAMAGGQTLALLYPGILRALALPGAFLFVLAGHGLITMIVISIAFEFAALLFSYWLVRRWRMIELLSVLQTQAVFLAILALVLGDAYFNPPSTALLENYSLINVVEILLLLSMPLAMAQTRAQGPAFWGQRKSA